MLKKVGPLYITYDETISGIERVGVTFIYVLLSFIAFIIVSSTFNSPLAFFIAGFFVRSITYNHTD